MKKEMSQRMLDVLKIFLSTDEALSSTDVCDRMRGLTQSTAISVIRNLYTEGCLEVTGVKHCGKVLGRVYKATPDAIEVLKNYFIKYYLSFSNVVSISEACNAILSTLDDTIRKEELEKLLDHINNIEK